MTFEVEYTERACEHVSEALDWISERSLDAATRWLAELEAAVISLESNPERHSYAPENAKHEIEIRQLLLRKRRGQYRVLFTINESKVVILDVRHSMQDWLQPGELD